MPRRACHRAARSAHGVCDLLVLEIKLGTSHPHKIKLIALLIVVWGPGHCLGHGFRVRGAATWAVTFLPIFRALVIMISTAIDLAILPDAICQGCCGCSPDTNRLSHEHEGLGCQKPTVHRHRPSLGRLRYPAMRAS